MVCEEKDGSSDSVPPLRRGHYSPSRFIQNIELLSHRSFSLPHAGRQAGLRSTASLREVPA